MAEAADRRLPDDELEVLSNLHPRREATARDIREDLSDHPPLAHGWVPTLLVRRDRRGLVARTARKIGKAHVYEPTRKPSAAVRPVLRRLVDRVFAGSAVELVASLFETRPPTAQELAAIQRLVRDARKKKDGAK